MDATYFFLEKERSLGTVRPLKKLVRGVYVDSNTYKSPIAINVEYYLKTIEKTEKLNSVSAILNIALENWINRI